jgi:sec-independent protein translocase protein TatA
MRIGAPELLIILLIVLVLFGPKQLPKLTKMFGKSVKSFKEGMEEDEETEKPASEVQVAETKSPESEKNA